MAGQYGRRVESGMNSVAITIVNPDLWIQTSVFSVSGPLRYRVGYWTGLHHLESLDCDVRSYLSLYVNAMLGLSASLDKKGVESEKHSSSSNCPQYNHKIN